MTPFFIINKDNKTQEEIQNFQRLYASRCVLFDENDNLIMVSLDSKKKGRGRYFGIPGGKIEEGETPGNACRREIREEAGFIISEITPIGSIELIQKDHISVSYGYVARVLLSDQKQLDLTPEEQEENFKTEVLSYNQVIDLLQKQYVYHHQAATLRNLTFILEAKRVLDSKE